MRRDRLAEARKAKGLTQEKLAEILGVERQTVSDWERGQATPQPHQRPPYAEALKVTHQELGAMLSSIPIGDDETPDWLTTYLGMEQSATELRAHEPRAIYGLFQTPSYTEAVVRTVGIDGASDSYVKRSIDQRIYRQQRVRNGDLVVDVIQPEWALHMQMGTPAVMAEQLDTMAELAELPNITTRVAPYTMGLYEAQRLGDFVIMLHPWGNPRVHLESYSGGRFITDADEVNYFSLAFERATRIVLSPRDSLAFIRQQADQWRLKDEQAELADI